VYLGELQTVPSEVMRVVNGTLREDEAPAYLAFREVLSWADDPFQAIDQDGVGKLVRIAMESGRKTRPGMKAGICGEHGGYPRSISCTFLEEFESLSIASQWYRQECMSRWLLGLDISHEDEIRSCGTCSYEPGRRHGRAIVQV
jgi:hypothetical protein